MKKFNLSEKEKVVLYGLSKYPNYTDKLLSKKLNLKHSTVTAIRHRLHKNEYFRKLIIPKLQNMGCQLLVATYTNFNPLIPLEERIAITGEAIEVFEEIFFSVGEQDKGFSLSLSRDYATIGKINDIRIETFGSRGFLEEEYSNMVIFPFKISTIYRFFDFAPLLNNAFNLNFENDKKINDFGLKNIKNMIFSDTEKNVYCMMISYPEMSDEDIGREIGVSRQTVSRLRRRFQNNNLIERISLPNLQKVGFEILTFYHIKFDPRNPPNMENNAAINLIDDSTIFFACRKFEAVMISIYLNFEDYKTDSMRIMHILKENKWIAEDPIIRTYGLNTTTFIKDFKFAPITHKIVGSDVWVKKLLNI